MSGTDVPPQDKQKKGKKKPTPKKEEDKFPKDPTPKKEEDKFPKDPKKFPFRPYFGSGGDALDYTFSGGTLKAHADNAGRRTEYAEPPRRFPDDPGGSELFPKKEEESIDFTKPSEFPPTTGVAEYNFEGGTLATNQWNRGGHRPTQKWEQDALAKMTSQQHDDYIFAKPYFDDLRKKKIMPPRPWGFTLTRKIYNWVNNWHDERNELYYGSKDPSVKQLMTGWVSDAMTVGVEGVEGYGEGSIISLIANIHNWVADGLDRGAKDMKWWRTSDSLVGGGYRLLFGDAEIEDLVPQLDRVQMVERPAHRIDGFLTWLSKAGQDGTLEEEIAEALERRKRFDEWRVKVEEKAGTHWQWTRAGARGTGHMVGFITGGPAGAIAKIEKSVGMLGQKYIRSRTQAIGRAMGLGPAQLAAINSRDVALRATMDMIRHEPKIRQTMRRLLQPNKALAFGIYSGLAAPEGPGGIEERILDAGISTALAPFYFALGKIGEKQMQGLLKMDFPQVSARMLAGLTEGTGFAALDWHTWWPMLQEYNKDKPDFEKIKEGWQQLFGTAVGMAAAKGLLPSQARMLREPHTEVGKALEALELPHRDQAQPIIDLSLNNWKVSTKGNTSTFRHPGRGRFSLEATDEGYILRPSSRMSKQYDIEKRAYSGEEAQRLVERINAESLVDALQNRVLDIDPAEFGRLGWTEAADGTWFHPMHGYYSISRGRAMRKGLEKNAKWKEWHEVPAEMEMHHIEDSVQPFARIWGDWLKQHQLGNESLNKGDANVLRSALNVLGRHRYDDPFVKEFYDAIRGDQEPSPQDPRAPGFSQPNPMLLEFVGNLKTAEARGDWIRAMGKALSGQVQSVPILAEAMQIAEVRGRAELEIKQEESRQEHARVRARELKEELNPKEEAALQVLMTEPRLSVLGKEYAAPLEGETKMTESQKPPLTDKPKRDPGGSTPEWKYWMRVRNRDLPEGERLTDKEIERVGEVFREMDTLRTEQAARGETEVLHDPKAGDQGATFASAEKHVERSGGRQSALMRAFTGETTSVEEQVGRDRVAQWAGEVELVRMKAKIRSNKLKERFRDPVTKLVDKASLEELAFALEGTGNPRHDKSRKEWLRVKKNMQQQRFELVKEMEGLDEASKVAAKKKIEEIDKLIEEHAGSDLIDQLPDVMKRLHKKAGAWSHELLEEIRPVFNKMFKEKVESGQLTAERFIDEYVTHIWDLAGSPGSTKRARSWSTARFAQKDKFTKERKIASLAEGIREHDLIPREQQLHRILELYETQHGTIQANRRLVGDLMRVEFKLPEGFDPYTPEPASPGKNKKKQPPGGRRAWLKREIADLERELGETPETRQIVGKEWLESPRGRELAESDFVETGNGWNAEVGGKRFRIQQSGDKWVLDRKTSDLLIEPGVQGTERFVDAGKSKSEAIDAVNHWLKRELPKVQAVDVVKGSEPNPRYTDARARLEKYRQDLAKIKPVKSFRAMMTTDSKMGKLAMQSGQYVEFEGGNAFTYTHKGSPKIEKYIVHRDLIEGTGIRPAEGKGPLGKVMSNPTKDNIFRFAKALGGVQKSMELSLSGFHAVAVGFESAFFSGGKLNPVANFLEGRRLMLKTKIAEDAVMHNLKIGVTSDIDHNAVFDLLTALGKIGSIKGVGLKQFTDIAKTIKHGTDKILWDHIHTYAKLDAYNRISTELEIRYPERARTADGRARLKRKAASFVNDAFGGQAWETAWRMSESRLRFLQWGMLSPDWTISNLKIAGRAMWGVAGEPLAAGGRKVKEIGYKLRGEEMPEHLKGELVETSHNARAYFARVAFMQIAVNTALQYALIESLSDDDKKKWLKTHGPESKEGMAAAKSAQESGLFMPSYAWWNNTEGKEGHIFIGYDEETGQELYVMLGKQYHEVGHWIDRWHQTWFSKAAPMVRMIAEQSGLIHSQIGIKPEWVKAEGRGESGIPERVAAAGKTFLPLWTGGNSWWGTLPLSRAKRPHYVREHFEDSLHKAASGHYNVPGLQHNIRTWLSGVIPGFLKPSEKPDSDRLKRRAREAIYTNTNPHKAWTQAMSAARERYYDQMWNALTSADSAEDLKAKLKEWKAGDANQHPLKKAARALNRLGVTRRDMKQTLTKRYEGWTSNEKTFSLAAVTKLADSMLEEHNQFTAGWKFLQISKELQGIEDQIQKSRDVKSAKHRKAEKVK